jgi:aspartate/methionine/tyrosine aminotransferase
MLNARLDLLNDYPFQLLADLLAPVSPRANVPPVVMSVGDPQHQPPAFVREIIDRESSHWNEYPALAGTPAFRAACVGWLSRRYRLKPGAIDPETQVTPVAGTREGLFQAALLAVTGGRDSGARDSGGPVALMPNPCYQIYYGAAVMAGAEPIMMPATKATGFLPDLAAIAPETLARTQIMYLCTPGNPQGAVASLEYLKQAIELAREHDFLLVVDECYAEIYSSDTPPPGAVEAASAIGGGLDNMLILHSLSKRSSAAGMRSGFALASPKTIERFNRLRSYACAATPRPVLDAAAALWNDDQHASETRARYRAKIDAAERILGRRFGFYRPPGGFFLWLDVGDGIAAAKKLWAEAAIRTLPGAYLTKPDRDGSNSGQPYLRVALVHELDVIETGLTRLAQVL